MGTELPYRPRLKIYKNSTGNVTFDPKTMEAYSYNWIFVKKIKGKVVFNDYNYSPTTSGHQIAVKAVLRELKIKFISVHTEADLNEFKTEALPSLYEEIFKKEAKLKYARLGKLNRDWYPERIKNLKKTIKEYRQLGAVCSREQIKKMKNEAYKEEQERQAFFKSDLRHSQLEDEREFRKQLKEASEDLLSNSFKNN
jgi:hypothetical protein